MKSHFVLLILLYFAFVFPTEAQLPSDSLSIHLAPGSIISKSSKVIEWQDLSSNKRHAKTISTSYPVNEQFSRNSSVAFNGLNNFMETPPFATFSNKRGTIFIVFKLNGKGNGFGGFSSLISTFRGEGVAWQFSVGELIPGQTIFSFYDGTTKASKVFPTFGKTGEWQLLTINRIDDNKIELYNYGYSNSEIEIADNVPDVNTLKIGSRGDNYEVFNGEIAEVIIYNRSLSKQEITKVQSVLISKYGFNSFEALFKRNWIYMLILSTALFITLLIYVLYRNYSLRNSIHKVALKRKAEEEERGRIAKDIHDELGSGLSKIIFLTSDLKIENQQSIETIKQTAKSLVDNMRDLVWSMNQENSNLQMLIACIKEYSSDYLEEFPIQFKSDFPDQIPAVRLTNEIYRNILMIVKEALQNIVKHSAADTVEMNVKLEPVLQIIIRDNGKGFNQVDSTSGNGLRHFDSRAASINAELEIKSDKNGTQLLIKLKYR